MNTEVHGYASQTGPERTNRRLAWARADAVSRRIGERATELYEDAWLGRPVPRGISGPLAVDHPGLESSCNRAAYFHFVVKREFVEPYDIEEAKAWLQRDLHAACGGAPPELLGPSPRLHAKARFVLATSYLYMMDAGYCTPLQGTPAYRLLGGDHDSADAAMRAAYDLANDPSENPYISGLDSSGARARYRERSATDPYYRYTYAPRSQEIGDIADSVELEQCGSVTQW